jgi:hypothetical protein
MISKLIESFVSELQKEDTQEYINNILSPYLSKYKYYLCLITFILFVLTIATSYNTYILHSLIRVNN